MLLGSDDEDLMGINKEQAQKICESILGFLDDAGLSASSEAPTRLIDHGSFPVKSPKHLGILLKRPFKDLKRITDHADDFYDPFPDEQVKPDGSTKIRMIDNPRGELKKIQHVIDKRLLSTLVMPDSMHGGLKGKSPATNAKPHVGKSVVVKIDIKDCFPSTSNDLVYESFTKILGCVPDAARVLTRLTTYQGHLPQGAPTSTRLCNVCLLPLEKDIHDIAQSLGLVHTIFVDDIALSGERAREAILPVIKKVLQYGYSVRAKKINPMPNTCKQTVTGVGVNKKPSARGDKFEQVRQRISCLSSFEGDLEKELESIIGFVSYVRSVNTTQANNLKRLLEKVLG